MTKKRRTAFFAAGLAMAMGMAGCSGGGGSGGSSPSGTVSALTVADKVSVVDAKAETNPSGILRGLFLSGVQFPADSDYSKDRTFTYVNDHSTQAFSTVNEILCMLSQARYDVMLNQGPYKALINKKQCSGNDSASSSSQQSGSSGSAAPEYETWTLDVTRADNDSPQTVKAWVHEKGDGQEPEKVIHARMTVNESSSSTNPYGIFTLHFAAYPASNGVQTSNTIMFKGVLKAERDTATGKVLLKFVDEQADGNSREQASLDKRTDGTGGGTVYQYGNYGSQVNESTLSFAYNADYFLRHKVGAPSDVCLDRNNFETSAWRYGLYDSNGGRVNRNSGFPIKYTSNGTGINGWIGYWGLWLPNDVNVPNGATVYKQSFGPGGGTETPYTVVKVGGKLKKHTKHTTTLAGIKNIPLEGYNELNTTYRVIWNGSQLVKIASATQNFNGPLAWTEIAPTPIDTSHLQFGELNFWSQSLGGQVRVKLADCDFNSGVTACSAPTGDTAVVYFTEDIVYPGDSVPATLACYDNCSKAGATGMDPTDLTYANSYDPTVDNRHNYSFGSDMNLMDGTNQVLLETAPDNQPWGFNSGPLFEANDANMAQLACDWNSSQTCGWKAWGALDVFYTWETGPNSWNQLSALKNPTSGLPLRFDPPLRVEYVHSQTDSAKPDYKYNGVKFYLDYNGFGELNGIPGKCFNMNTGQTVLDCSGQNTRWVPEFTIAEGSTVTYNSTTYYVKPLEVEQRMRKLSSGCENLAITAYQLPDISDWVNPNIGAEPAVTSAPAVIAGVPQ